MGQQKIQEFLIWDTPTRVFHWLLVSGFTTCYLTGENDHWALIHITGGYMVLGLILFRILWGFIGTQHALFRNFICGPRAGCNYLISLCRNKARHYAGHNPAGAMAIVTLITLGLLVTITGIMISEGESYPSLDKAHAVTSSLMLGMVFIHVIGVLLGSLLHKENLIGAMITGYKPNCEREGISQSYRWLGIALACFVTLFWIFSLKEKIL